jgi:hypothetical protein
MAGATMPTFGFSYLLKILCINERPQRTEIRRRLQPSDSAYDYHRSLRLRIQRHLMRGEDIDDVIASTDEIAQPPERNSARTGLERLRDWRAANPVPVFECAPVIIESPDGRFRVRYEPDFGIVLSGRRTAVHVWNNIRPNLQDRMVYAALSLVAEGYGSGGEALEDFAVLSLQTGRLYRWSDVPDHSLLAARLVTALDRLVTDLLGELEGPPEGPEDRPGTS